MCSASPVITSVPAQVDMTMQLSSNRSTSSTPDTASFSRPSSVSRWYRPGLLLVSYAKRNTLSYKALLHCMRGCGIL